MSVLPTLDPLHILALHCPQCPFLTLSVTRLFEHCMEHSEPSDCTLFQCQQCGIVSTHQGILEEHIKAWHPSAPFVLKQISKTTLKCSEESLGTKQHKCHFCNFHSMEHHKINLHYFQIHNVTNVALEKRERTVSKSLIQNSTAPSLTTIVPRIQRNGPVNLIKLPAGSSASSLTLMTSSSGLTLGGPCVSSDSSPLLAAALNKPSTVSIVSDTSSSSSACLKLVSLTNNLDDRLGGAELARRDSAGLSSADVHDESVNSVRSASRTDLSMTVDDDEDCVLVLDDKVDESDGMEEDEEDSSSQTRDSRFSLVTDNSLIMESLVDAKSSILTMSLNPDDVSRVTKDVNGGSFMENKTTPICNGNNERDKVPIEMLTVTSFGRRYEVLTRNLRQMGGELQIGRRLDKGTLDFSCQCDYCGRVVKLSKPKAYKFKIHLRTCKEHRKQQVKSEPNGDFSGADMSVIGLPKGYVPLDSGSEQDSLAADASNPSRTATPLAVELEESEVNVLGIPRKQPLKQENNAIECS